jgi:hypothetical protein
MKADLLRSLLPYTCVAGSDAGTLAQSYAADLARDPLFQEYQKLFGVG